MLLVTSTVLPFLATLATYVNVGNGNIVERCFDIVAILGHNVERILRPFDNVEQIKHVQFWQQYRTIEQQCCFRNTSVDGCLTLWRHVGKRHFQVLFYMFARYLTVTAKRSSAEIAFLRWVSWYDISGVTRLSSS